MDAFDILARALRMMAWERAKGELRSMCQSHLNSRHVNHAALEAAINNFIKEVEENDLHE